MDTIVGKILAGSQTWVIEDFLDEPWYECRRSPPFLVDEDGAFHLKVHQTDTDVRIWLCLGHFIYIPLDTPISFSLSLVAQNGTLKEVCAKKESTFSERYWTPEVPDATFSKQDLTPEFLPDGVLRIHCSFDSFKFNDKEKEDQDAKPSLAENIEKEVHKFCDFTFECGDQEIPVNRLLLAARSRVFSVMFSENFQEAKTGRTIIKDVDQESLEALVKFCHTNNLDEVDLTTDLLAAANKYMIPELVEKCEEHLSKTMSADNAIDYFLAACLHEANNLRTASKKFITKNLDKVKKTESFKNLGKESLVEVLEYACKKNGR
jgi:hypothetical protein